MVPPVDRGADRRGGSPACEDRKDREDRKDWKVRQHREHREHRDLRDLREGGIIDLVSDLRERRDGVAREIDPRVVAGLIQFEQLRQNEEVARLRQENQSLREVNARLLGAARAAPAEAPAPFTGEGQRLG